MKVAILTMRYRLRTLLYVALFALVVLTGAWLGMFLLGPPDSMGRGSVVAGCIGALVAAVIFSWLREHYTRPI